MLIFSLSKHFILVSLLLFPLVCHAEQTDAPPKFYAGLQSKAEQLSQYYTVKKNESLSAIAARYDYNYLQLAQWNDIPEPYHVVAGQRLQMFEKKILQADKKRAAVNPNLDAEDDALTQSYVVGKSESLSVIAIRFKVASEQLAAWNGITSPNQVYAGQKLKIFKNKQKHSTLESAKNPAKNTENLRDNSQKTSIISINNKSMLKFYCHWPTKGKVIKTFSQTGGRGIEISGKVGQIIKATATGKVVAVSAGIYGHGSFIVIKHGNSYLSSYANNTRSLVKNGQAVAQGQAIAEMGRVGHKAPSLEFEIRINGKLVDPQRFLPKKI